MIHAIETKKVVLSLVKHGLNVKSISVKTKIIEKTIAKWVKERQAKDQPKIEILDSLWQKLSGQSKAEKLSATEIASIKKQSKTTNLIYDFSR